MGISSSFNGVTFMIRGITTGGFNNSVVMHDVVNGEYGPYIEVMGRGAEIYDVDAFVSYTFGTYLEKDLIVQQFKTDKTGEFYHPEYGIKNCACLAISVSEDARQIGVISIRLQLVVVNNDYYNISGTSTGGLISTIEKAVNVVSDPVGTLGLNTTCLGLLGTGINSVTGFTSTTVLSRYLQSGTNILSEAGSLSAAISSVEANNSAVISKLSNV